MPKVLCTLPNASDEINGVKFTAVEDGVKLSEEVSQEVADAFAAIPGYEIDGESKVVKTPATTTPASKPAPAAKTAPAKQAGGKKGASPAPAPAPAAPADQTPPADGAGSSGGEGSGAGAPGGEGGDAGSDKGADDGASSANKDTDDTTF